jgi:hypothetical protein
MLETHIVMSSLISCLVLILMLCLTSFMDLTALCLDALVIAHIVIVVIISHIGPVFLLEGLALNLSPDTWTFHVFSVVVHVPLVQMVKCKGL